MKESAMTTRASTVEFLLDQLASLPGVRARKMFGEYAIYFEEKVVALVCDDDLFLKLTPEAKSWLGAHYREGIPYPGAKPAILIQGEALEQRAQLEALVRMTAAALPPPAQKKPRSKTPKRPLKRELQPMSEDVRLALEGASLREAYEARPPFQRNDYLAWISRAKLGSTRTKRLHQMLAELRGGDTYMNMPWRRS